jgi:endo-1,4-beta-xylanase
MLGLIAREFNAITTENALKWEPVHPSEKKWNFKGPDKFIEFGEINKMFIQGHVLVWHRRCLVIYLRMKVGNKFRKVYC